MPTTGLYWFTNDLRVSDNDLLHQASEEVDVLICLYCLPTLTPFLCDFSLQHQLGAPKQRFVAQSAHDLNATLQRLGQQLWVFESEPTSILEQVIRQHNVTHFYCSHTAGSDEQHLVANIEVKFPNLNVAQRSVGSLFQLAELPFDLKDLPDTFTQFRKKVESLPLAKSKTATSLPRKLELTLSSLSIASLDSLHDDDFLGGESAGQRHCEHYFSTHLASEYKQTRNGLEGMDYSTKFSPWLALGCLSPHYILQRLNTYERQQGANDSTYWIYFELLWREYFYWYGRKHQDRLFCFSGITPQTPTSSFDKQRFEAWVQGETLYPIVNACMKQLQRTGYMSNRGRQLVASCLIHELALDWRYGAAYFESQLIDYDVGSNWGNWQYLAGVGADPRSSRQFNLQKQTEIYDPDGRFIQKWTQHDGEENR